ncbi:Serine threonine-protein kinase [Musa troglodytarum]|uniref:Serine threonine-protein kinase n=1 Tax=Musa troglodytarum TaxID=320322 RepID=A0A9E7KKX2_9LILI|nr:Serine threonine-protein kinase [Musa troglodytarum]
MCSVSACWFLRSSAAKRTEASMTRHAASIFWDTLWREGKGLELVDEAIGDSYPKAEVLRCMKVGLLCVQERPEDRPTMSAVMLMLGSDSALLPQPRQPGFVAMRGPLDRIPRRASRTRCPSTM